MNNQSIPYTIIPNEDSSKKSNSENMEASPIIKCNNYNIILVPLKDITNKLAIIYPNIFSMMSYKDIIDNVIGQLDESLEIDLYKLYHSPTVNDDQENVVNQNIIEIKKYNIMSQNYNYELIETWISDVENNYIDSIDDLKKIDNFEIALFTALVDHTINNIIIFGHSNSVYDTLLLNNNLNNKKYITYVSFDANNMNAPGGPMYNLYINKNHCGYHNFGQLYDDIKINIVSNINIFIPSIEKSPTFTIYGSDGNGHSVHGLSVLDQTGQTGHTGYMEQTSHTENINYNQNYPNDIYSYRAVKIPINTLNNVVQDCNDIKYYPFIMFKQDTDYVYKIRKYFNISKESLESPLDNIILKDINLNQLIIRSIYNLLNDSPDEYLIDNMEKITEIYNSLVFTGLHKTYLGLKNKILEKYSDALNVKKNKYIEHNKVVLKTDKFNIIELLQTFAKHNQFKFGSVKKQIKQNKNIIKNYTSVVKCQEDIIKWENTFNIFDITLNKNQFDASCDLYNLLLSRTTWYEELQNGNIIGILLHLVTPKLAKLGIIMDKIKIMEISNNLITFENLCEAQDIYVTTKNNYDNGRSD